MIFKNRTIGNTVTVDIDTYYYFFLRPQDEIPEDEKQGITLSTVRDRIQRLISYMPPAYGMNMDIHYRRSSNDHVHVRIRFVHDIEVLDGFMIRAWMLDDQTRLELDLARYLKTDDLHEMNRCFDEKATDQGIKKAGPWVPLSCDRDHLPGDAFYDYKIYVSQRWAEFLNGLAVNKNSRTNEQKTLDKT